MAEFTKYWFSRNQQTVIEKINKLNAGYKIDINAYDTQADMLKDCKIVLNELYHESFIDFYDLQYYLQLL